MMPGQRFGPFEIETELGSGAMGTVYRARFDQDGRRRTVALKVVAFGLAGNDSALARFEREGAILKQLRHPHIVRLFAVGRKSRTPFLAMEYIDGEALDRVLARRGRLGWEEVVQYGRQLCEALQHAHAKGIIHRDLKPSNLMVTKDGVLKLTDFGIAKDDDATALTAANSTIGTAAYMSPEQCKGLPLSAKSDLYSLGVVFYELLTGEKPFVAETTIEMFTKHVSEVPVRPSRRTADIPVWLDNLVMFLLEKERDLRPLDAATVGRMLGEIEQKVADQHSAAAEVANARRGDRPLNDPVLDRDDVAAAKAVRAAAGPAGKKKGKKRKAKPPAERAWVRAVPVLLALAGVIGVGVYLYQRTPPGGTTAATGGPTAGPAPDLREQKGRELQGVLDRRFQRRNAALKVTTAQEDEDAAAHDAAWAAMEAEEKGDLAKAVADWGRVKARAPEAGDKYGPAWGWVADHRIGEIGKADAALAEVVKAIDDREVNESEWKQPDGDPLRPAADAVRLAGLPTPEGQVRRPPPDPERARAAWDRVAEAAAPPKDAAKADDRRVWRLLAARERKKLGDEKPSADARRKALAEYLEVLKAEWQRVAARPDERAARRDLRNRLRDVSELYADDPDEPVKKLAAAAKATRAEVQKAG
jgi:serine/threonine-protein kinase